MAIQPRKHPVSLTRYGLTQAEYDVMQLVIQGQTTTEIAAIRGTSVHTVWDHYAAVKRKTGATTLARAVFLLWEDIR